MRRHVLLVLAMAMLLGLPSAWAKIPDEKIKIGVLQDLPGPFASETGEGGIVAAQMAAGDFETKYLRGDAEILPHVSEDSPKDLEKVREWLDVEHVAAVISSAPANVNRQIARMVAKRHVSLLVAATDTDMGGVACMPNVVVWGAGPGARARALARVLVPHGGKQWFVVAQQTTNGLAQQSAVQKAVSDLGGSVVGSIEHPLGDSELRSKTEQITKSKAQVLALAESENDLVSALRIARLSGLSSQMTLVAPYAQTTDVDNAGPSVAQGLLVPAPFYWNTDGRTREFALKWSSRMQAQPVTENAAEIYAATLSFLRAAKSVDDISAGKVLPELRRAPIKDTLFGTVTVRKDGRVIYDLPVYRVKAPNAVQHRWDYFTQIATVPAAQVFPPQQCGGGGQGK